MRRLLRERRGVAAVQFAIVAPVMLAVMMGLGDLAYQEYVQSVLAGAVQKAARDAGIQGNATQTDFIDAKVKQQLSAIVASPTFASTRVNYDNYAAMAGEPFTDKSYGGTFDGVCDHGETYVDLNNNGHYDLDLSSPDEGGPGDLTRYTMQVTYRRLFPVGLVGWGTYVTLSATTLVKNQPYGPQSAYNNNTTGTCP